MTDLVLKRHRRVPVVLQAEEAECGLASLAMIAAHFGYRVDLTDLRHRYRSLGVSPTLNSILSIADTLGLIGRPVRLGLVELDRLALPAILHWKFDHFVVLVRFGRRGAVVHDPSVGRRLISSRELEDAFTGVAVEFSAAAHFAADASGRVPLLRSLVRSFTGLTSFLGVMLGLLLVTQLLALVPPVATQLLIDEVVMGRG